MNVKPAITVAILQVGLLAFMAGQREWISRFGDQLTLRTAPVDPNDPMRGAYVRLNYEITNVPVKLLKDGPAEWVKPDERGIIRSHRDETVYAELGTDGHGLATLVSLSDRKPSKRPMLRGRVDYVNQGGVEVRYGIEALFMHRDAARQMESDQREARAGAPLKVSVAVSSSGVGVLKDYEWEPLGITLEFDRARPDDPANPVSTTNPRPGLEGLTVVLHNYGDKDFAVVDLPGDLSFRLVPTSRWAPGYYTWVGEGATFKIPAPTADNIIVLKPGETHRRHIDLTTSYWQIIDSRKAENTPIAIRDVADPWTASFRIEYAPPGEEALAGLPNADLVRHTPLRSRQFTANRRID